MDKGLQYLRSILPDALGQSTKDASGEMRQKVDGFTKTLIGQGYDSNAARDIAVGCARRAEKRGKE